MKDISSPVPPDQLRKVVQKCLEKAALVNYSQLTDYAKIEGWSSDCRDPNIRGTQKNPERVHYLDCGQRSLLLLFFLLPLLLSKPKQQRQRLPAFSSLGSQQE